MSVEGSHIDTGEIDTERIHKPVHKLCSSLTCAWSIIQSEAAAFLALATTAPTSSVPVEGEWRRGATSTCSVNDDDMLDWRDA